MSESYTQRRQVIILLSIKSHTEKYKLKWRDRIYIISAQSIQLFAGQAKKRHLKAKENKM